MRKKKSRDSNMSAVFAEGAVADFVILLSKQSKAKTNAADPAIRCTKDESSSAASGSVLPFSPNH